MSSSERRAELRRRLRLLRRRLNLFDPSRAGETPRGNTSGPTADTKDLVRRG